MSLSKFKQSDSNRASSAALVNITDEDLTPTSDLQDPVVYSKAESLGSPIQTDDDDDFFEQDDLLDSQARQSQELLAKSMVKQTAKKIDSKLRAHLLTHIKQATSKQTSFQRSANSGSGDDQSDQEDDSFSSSALVDSELVKSHASTYLDIYNQETSFPKEKKKNPLKLRGPIQPKRVISEDYDPYCSLPLPHSRQLKKAGDISALKNISPIDFSTSYPDFGFVDTLTYELRGEALTASNILASESIQRTSIWELFLNQITGKKRNERFDSILGHLQEEKDDLLKEQILKANVKARARLENNSAMAGPSSGSWTLKQMQKEDSLESPLKNQTLMKSPLLSQNHTSVVKPQVRRGGLLLGLTVAEQPEHSNGRLPQIKRKQMLPGKTYGEDQIENFLSMAAGNKQRFQGMKEKLALQKKAKEEAVFVNRLHGAQGLPAQQSNNDQFWDMSKKQMNKLQDIKEQAQALNDKNIEEQRQFNDFKMSLQTPKYAFSTPVTPRHGERVSSIPRPTKGRRLLVPDDKVKGYVEEFSRKYSPNKIKPEEPAAAEKPKEGSSTPPEPEVGRKSSMKVFINHGRRDPEAPRLSHLPSLSRLSVNLKGKSVDQSRVHRKITQGMKKMKITHIVTKDGQPIRPLKQQPTKAGIKDVGTLTASLPSPRSQIAMAPQTIEALEKEHELARRKAHETQNRLLARVQQITKQEYTINDQEIDADPVYYDPSSHPVDSIPTPQLTLSKDEQTTSPYSISQLGQEIGKWPNASKGAQSTAVSSTNNLSSYQQQLSFGHRVYRNPAINHHKKVASSVTSAKHGHHSQMSEALQYPVRYHNQQTKSMKQTVKQAERLRPGEYLRRVQQNLLRNFQARTRHGLDYHASLGHRKDDRELAHLYSVNLLS